MQFDGKARVGSNRLAQWEGETTVFDDHAPDWLWEGIHIRIAERFGADYLRRYVRAWRNDDTVRDLIAGPNRPSNWSTLVTREQRATLQVAAISAAVRQDLRSQFRTWRFPIHDTLFQALYDHFLTAMNTPL